MKTNQCDLCFKHFANIEGWEVHPHPREHFGGDLKIDTNAGDFPESKIAFMVVFVNDNHYCEPCVRKMLRTGRASTTPHVFRELNEIPWDRGESEY